MTRPPIARPSSATAALLAICFGACAPGTESLSGEDDDASVGVRNHTSSLLVVGEESFTAYYGGSRFDPDAVFGVAEPEITFNAFRAPLVELDGEMQDIDLSQPSNWVVMMNLHYAADVDVLWHVATFEAGMPGLWGNLRVNGSRDPVSFAVQYNFHFAGDMDLPGFSDNPVDLQISSENLGMAPAEEIRQARGL